MTKNTAASVRARLSNQARASRRPFQEALQHYGLERFLYRLGRSSFGGRFVLKGGLLLRAWGAPMARPTRDIDLLGFVENEIGVLEAIMREVCAAPVAEDGLVFDGGSVRGQRIKEGAEYQGVRITFTGFLDNARLPMQLDIAFGDVVHPRAEEHDYPTLLDLPAPRLRMYPRESVVAEKFEAMVHLGTLNSRMKDFFDLWLLASQFDFRGSDLALAVEKTFAHRGTPLDPEPVALTAAFTSAESTQRQWVAFAKRSQLGGEPRALDDLREPLRQFLLPVVSGLIGGRAFDLQWKQAGPWHDVRAGGVNETTTGDGGDE